MSRMVSGTHIAVMGREKAIEVELARWRLRDGDRFDYVEREQKGDHVVFDLVPKEPE